MPTSALRALRYVWGWTRSRQVETERLSVGGGPEPVAATLYRPAGHRGPRAAWVVLHGVTPPGPDHPALVRFAHALAGSGGLVMVPNVPHWRRLSLDPGPAQRIILKSVEHLAGRPEARPGGVGLVGFSFGCPQAVIAGAAPSSAPHIRGVAGFGGYCDLRTALLFQLTGVYQWKDRPRYLRPDPYGRWVVAANYLHRIPGFEGAEDVSEALGRLATLAGERRVKSWDPSYDSVKSELLERVAPENHDLFRLFAPAADRDPDRDRAEELAPLLAEAARATHPLLDPVGALAGVLPPVRLVHGRRDHLIPFTETLALARRLPTGTDVRATVTDLFSHSEESQRRFRPAEAMRFFSALRHMMALAGRE